MTGSGRREFGRRGAALVFITLGAATFWVAGLWPASAGFLAAVAVYVLPPHLRPPKGAVTYDRGPAVIGPDLLGFALFTGFLMLPLLAGRMEGGGLHPSALLAWPMALAGVALLAVGAWHASFWLELLPDRLILHDWRRELRLQAAEIARVAPWRRGLPGWVTVGIAPALAMAGRPGQAGPLRLARDTTGLALCRADGTGFHIALDGLGAGRRRLLAWLSANGWEVGHG